MAEITLEHILSKIESTLQLHTWILTFNTAMLALIIGKLFLPGGAMTAAAARA